jgi:transcriptional regulator with XRE-family HTH domain
MQAIERSTTAEEEPLAKAFGIALHCLRQDCGLSQEDLGFKSGYHRTYISLLERGKKSPSLQTIFRLSEALNIDPSELIKQVQSRNDEFIKALKAGDD